MSNGKGKYRRRRNPLYLTTTEIARRYGFHVNTPGNWCRQGLLPYIRGAGGKYLIKRDDLEKFFGEYYEEIP